METSINSSLKSIALTVARPVSYNIHTTFLFLISFTEIPPGGVTSGPGVTVPNVPNPGSDGGTFEITIVQSWSQETNYARVTQVWMYIQIYLDLKKNQRVQ